MVVLALVGGLCVALTKKKPKAAPEGEGIYSEAGSSL